MDKCYLTNKIDNFKTENDERIKDIEKFMSQPQNLL